MEDQDIKNIVKTRYGQVAKASSPCCSQPTSCCSPQNAAENISKSIGYSKEELKATPEGANLGLGCGNPVALASLQEGEIVLDLGSGAGFDCFLAANKVGKKGKIIGIDMTPEMIEKARENVEKGNYDNVEFRLGEIENLPLESESIDVIISNCVINLSPEKDAVFQEAFRVLKPGGRMMVSDIVLLNDLPVSIKKSVLAYTGCIAGALKKEDYIQGIKNAGFQKIEVLGEHPFPLVPEPEDPMVKAIADESEIKVDQILKMAQSVVSISICGYKPLDDQRKIGKHEKQENLFDLKTE